MPTFLARPEACAGWRPSRARTSGNGDAAGVLDKANDFAGVGFFGDRAFKPAVQTREADRKR